MHRKLLVPVQRRCETLFGLLLANQAILRVPLDLHQDGRQILVAEASFLLRENPLTHVVLLSLSIFIIVHVERFVVNLWLFRALLNVGYYL